MGRPRNQSADAYLDSPELIFVAEGLNVLFPCSVAAVRLAVYAAVISLPVWIGRDIGLVEAQTCIRALAIRNHPPLSSPMAAPSAWWWLARAWPAHARLAATRNSAAAERSSAGDLLPQRVCDPTHEDRLVERYAPQNGPKSGHEPAHLALRGTTWHKSALSSHPRTTWHYMAQHLLPSRRSSSVPVPPLEK